MVKMSGTLCDNDVDEREELDDREEEQEEDREDSQDEVGGDDVDTGDKPANHKTATDDILDGLAEAENECADAEREVSRCKSELKLARSNYEAAVGSLRSLCQAIQNDQTRPLMREFQEADKKAVSNATGNGDGNSDDDDDDDDDWRNTPLSELAILDGILEKLYEAGVNTVGELEDLRASISNGKAKWPKGIGSVKVSAIEDAILQWLAVNRG